MARFRVASLPSPETLIRLYDYNPETGEFRHKRREGGSKGEASFNTKYAGKVAGCVMNVGYRFIRAGGQALLAHRVAWAIHYGTWPIGEIDHRDGDKLNNAIDNLREVTRAQNCRNRPGRAVSGLKGVRLNGKCKSRWVASIQHHGRIMNLGSFGSAEEAHAAYVEAARKYHGEFAHTGVVLLGSISAMIAFEARA